MDLPQTNAGTD